MSTLQMEKKLQGPMSDWCESLFELHKELENCNETLSGVENNFASLTEELSTLNTQIKNLKNDSEAIHTKLTNRRETHLKLTEYLSHIVITPNTVQDLLSDPTSPNFAKALKNITQQLNYAQKRKTENIPSILNAISHLEKLRAKALSTLVTLLAEKIKALKKPKTNFQILQSSLLQRFPPLFALLKENSPPHFANIRSLYLTTLSQVYGTQIGHYYNTLCGLRVPVRVVDVLGSLIGGERGERGERDRGERERGERGGEERRGEGGGLFSFIDAFKSSVTSATSQMAPKRPSVALSPHIASPFALAQRESLLLSLDHPALSLHQVGDNRSNIVLTNERIDTSVWKIILESTITECVFLSECFSPLTFDVSTMHAEIFHSVLTSIVMAQEKQMNQETDLVSVLLRLRMIQAMASVCETQQLTVLSNFHAKYQQVAEKRLLSLLDDHLLSLDKTIGEGGSYLSAFLSISPLLRTQPHALIRAIGDMISSIHSLIRGIKGRRGDLSASISPLYLSYLPPSRKLEDKMKISLEEYIEKMKKIILDAETDLLVRIYYLLYYAISFVDSLSAELMKGEGRGSFQGSIFRINNLHLLLTLLEASSPVDPQLIVGPLLSSIASEEQERREIGEERRGEERRGQERDGKEWVEISELLDRAIHEYVGEAVDKMFEDEWKGIKNHEELIYDVVEIDEKAHEKFSNERRKEIEQQIRNFESSWRNKAEKIYGGAVSSLSNTNVVKKVLNLACARVLLMHSRLVRIAEAAYYHMEAPSVVRCLVSSSTLLVELQRIFKLS